MTENKEQTLANLYSIRAGISAVASQRNKVEAIKKQTADEVEAIKKQTADEVTVLKNEIFQFNKNKKENEDKIKNYKNEIERNRYNFNIYYDPYIKEKYIDDGEKYYYKFIPSEDKAEDIIFEDKRIKKPTCEIMRRRKSKRLSECFKLLIAPIFAIVYIFIYFYFQLYNDEIVTNYPLIVTFGCVLAAAFLVCIIFFFKFFIDLGDTHSYYEKIDYFFKYVVSSYNILKRLAKTTTDTINDLNQKITLLQREIEKDEALIAEKQKEIETRKEMCKKEIEMRKSAAENACVPYCQLGGMIQEQFENQFDSFLNLRDWKNVDIIIFAYESGRVDTMREALTYADGETRADRIVNAINASTQAICRSIQSGLHSLALSMGECFNVISRQIAEQTRKLDKISVNIENLSANTARLAENTASYSANLADLAAKVDYSNALQEQRYNSSKELVEKNEVFMLQARNYMDELYNNRYSLY